MIPYCKSTFQEESSTLELNSIRAIIKCVEDHKLESEFSLDSLRKRATHLEKAKAEWKKNSAAAIKPKNKRANGAGGDGGMQRTTLFSIWITGY